METYKIERVPVSSVSTETIATAYVTAGKAVVFTDVLSQGEGGEKGPWARCKSMADLRFFSTHPEVSKLEAEIAVQQSGDIQRSEDFEMELTAEAAMDLLQLRSTEDIETAKSGTDKVGEVIYVKLSLTGCESLMDELNLQAFANPKAAEEPFAASSHPLLLGPGCYFCWAYIGEAGTGSKTHVDVASSDAFLTVLSGKKEWAMVHPLDKHLVMTADGKFADLFNIDHDLFPMAKRARICVFTQEAGDCVFVPSEAPHCVRNIEASISITYNFSGASTNFRFHTAMDKIMSPQPTIATIDLLVFNPELKRRATLRAFVKGLPAPLPVTEYGCRMVLAQLHSAFGIYGRFLDAEKTAAVPVGYEICPKSHRAIYYYRMDNSEHFNSNFGRAPFASEQYEFDSTCEPANRFSMTSSHMGLVPNFPPLRVLIHQPLFSNEIFETTTVGDILGEEKTNPSGSVERQWHYSRFPFRHQQQAASSTWCQTYLFYSSHDLQGPISLHPLLTDGTLQTSEMLAKQSGGADGEPTQPTQYSPHFEALEWKASSSYRTGPRLYDLKDDLVGALTKRLVLSEGLLLSLFSVAEQHGFILGRSKDNVCDAAQKSHQVSSSDRIEALLSIGIEKVMILVLYFSCAPCVVGFSYSHTFSAVEEPKTICLTSAAADALLAPIVNDKAAVALSEYCNAVDPPTEAGYIANATEQPNITNLEKALIEAFEYDFGIVDKVTSVKATSRSKIELS